MSESVASKVCETIQAVKLMSVQVGVGAGYSCGITSTGVLKCAGVNTYGELAQGGVNRSWPWIVLGIVDP